MTSNSASDTEPDSDPRIVHCRFYDVPHFKNIRSIKRDHDATWREIIEYGARYLEILDAVTQVKADDAIQHLLTDAQETQPDLLEDTDVTPDFGTLYREEATESHGETPSSPKRDPDTPNS